LDEGAILFIHDPKVRASQIEKDLKQEQTENKEEKENKFLNKKGRWEFRENIEIFDNAHAVLILTEWEEYKNIDWINV